MKHKIIVVENFLLEIGGNYLSDKFPYPVAEKLTTGFFHLWEVSNPNDQDKDNQYQILAHRPLYSNVPYLEGIDVLPGTVLEENIRSIAFDVVLRYLTDNNPGGDFKRSTVEAGIQMEWWADGYLKGFRVGRASKTKP